MKACVATGSYDLSVRVWDANSRDSIITVPHPEAQINCLSFIPNASGTSDVDHIAIGTWQKLKIFDISQSTQPVISPSFEGASKNITACGFSLPIVHGCWMFTGGEDGHVRIFDTKPVTQRQHVQTLTCHNALEIGSPITSVVLHLNQIELFIADQSGRVHIWDLSKQVNKSIYVPELSTFEFVVKLAVRPLVTQEGHTILSGITNRGKILTWQLSQIDYNASPMAMDTTTEASFLGMARPTTQLNQERIGIGLTYTRDGRYLVASFADSEISWFPADNYPNYDTKEPIIFDIDCDWNWDTLVTVDSRYMFTGGSDGRLKYWDVENKKMITKIEGHQKGISALAISEH